MGRVVIGEDSVLLEHTLAMVGDVVEPGDIWVMEARAGDCQGG